MLKEIRRKVEAFPRTNSVIAQVFGLIQGSWLPRPQKSTGPWAGHPHCVHQFSPPSSGSQLLNLLPSSTWASYGTSSCFPAACPPGASALAPAAPQSPLAGGWVCWLPGWGWGHWGPAPAFPRSEGWGPCSSLHSYQQHLEHGPGMGADSELFCLRESLWQPFQAGKVPCDPGASVLSASGRLSSSEESPAFPSTAATGPSSRGPAAGAAPLTEE